MLQNSFLKNPIRLNNTFKSKFIELIKKPLINFLLWLGFTNIEYAYVHGDKRRLKIGNNCSTMNTLFNVISGNITIGDNTIFTHNCMVLTGTHIFVEGQRASLKNIEETPSEGRNIWIGSGCFIGSGSIILGNVSVGDNVIIAAGSVVTKDIPNNVFVGGIPAKIIKYNL